MHAAQELGVDRLQVLRDLVVEQLGVDEQRVYFVAEEIAGDPADQAGLALQQDRRARRGRLALDLLPLTVQVVDLTLAALLGEVLGDGADDPAAGVLRHELRHQLAQLGALLAIVDLAGDTDLGGERHVHQEPSGEGHLGGDARALGADRLFGDLDDLELAALQLVGHAREAAAPASTSPATPAVPATLALGAVPLPLLVPLPLTLAIPAVAPVLLVLVLRLDQVGGVQEGALLGSDVDERSLDPRQDSLDFAEVDVAHRAAGVGTIHQEFNKAVVL